MIERIQQSGYVVLGIAVALSVLVSCDDTPTGVTSQEGDEETAQTSTDSTQSGLEWKPSEEATLVKKNDQQGVRKYKLPSGQKVLVLRAEPVGRNGISSKASEREKGQIFGVKKYGGGYETNTLSKVGFTKNGGKADIGRVSVHYSFIGNIPSSISVNGTDFECNTTSTNSGNFRKGSVEITEVDGSILDSNGGLSGYWGGYEHYSGIDGSRYESVKIEYALEGIDVENMKGGVRGRIENAAEDNEGIAIGIRASQEQPGGYLGSVYGCYLKVKYENENLSAPSLDSPNDKEVIKDNGDSVTLKWSQPDGTPSFTVYLDDNSNFSSPREKSGINGTSYTFNNVDKGEKLYWKVSNGNATSETRSFWLIDPPSLTVFGPKSAVMPTTTTHNASANNVKNVYGYNWSVVHVDDGENLWDTPDCDPLNSNFNSGGSLTQGFHTPYYNKAKICARAKVKNNAGKINKVKSQTFVIDLEEGDQYNY